MGKKGAALSTEEEAMLGPSTPDQKLDELIESQRSKLTAMRESLQDELGAVEQFEDVVGDVRMFRFLRGFKFDVEAATESMRKMLIWRKENNIDAIRARVEGVEDWTELPHWSEIGRYFPATFDHKCDKDGRPLWISELGSVRVTALVNNVGIDTFMDFHIHLMEWKTLQLDRLSREKNFLVRMLVIRDLTGVGMHMLTKRARTLFSRIVGETQSNYPESMERNFFVNVPWVGHACWRIVRPMVAERSLHKIVFLSGDPTEELLAQIPAENLPACFGGSDESTLWPLFSGESERLTALTVARGAATYVHVPMAQGDAVSWELHCQAQDVGHDAVFVAGKPVQQPVSQRLEAAASGTATPPNPASPASGAADSPLPPSSAGGAMRGVIIDAAPALDLGGAAMVAEAARVSSHQQEYKAPGMGTLVVRLDNRYSWVMSKSVDFGVDVVPAAVADAETPEEQ